MALPEVVKLPDGRKVRINGTPALNTRLAAEEAERAHILKLLNPTLPAKEAPTIKDFKDQFLDHMRGNRRKASTVYAAEVALDAHILRFSGRSDSTASGMRRSRR